MSWTLPGHCDPRALADQERHSQGPDERHERELERSDRAAEHASLPAGHPALTDSAAGSLDRTPPEPRKETAMHRSTYRLRIPQPDDASAGPTLDDLRAALSDGLIRAGFAATADQATITTITRRPVSHVRHHDGRTASGGYSVDEFMAAHRSLEDQAFGVLHELLALGVRNDSRPGRIDVMSCNDPDELARQMHAWLDHHPGRAAQLQLARPGSRPAAAAA